MEIEVRCCCDPSIVLGTVEIPAADSHFKMFRFALKNGEKLVLQIGRIASMDYSGCREVKTALNSNETPIEILRQIPGSKETKFPKYKGING